MTAVTTGNNMTMFVVARNGKQTVAAIAQAMNATVAAKWFMRNNRTTWKVDGEKSPSPNLSGKVVIRWATGVQLEGTPEMEIQPAAGIILASNKPRARQALQAAGVAVPKTTTSKTTAQQWLDGGIAVVRRPEKHHGGIGFKIFQPGETISGNGYFSEFYAKTKEYRVHVGHGRILSMQEKVPVEGFSPVAEEPWNHATGNFVFKVIKWSQYDLNICRLAIKSVEVLGLDYAAVDILAEAPDSLEDAVVTEVNTSPGIADYMIEKYSKYFSAVLGGMTKRPTTEPVSSWRDIVFRSEE